MQKKGRKSQVDCQMQPNEGLRTFLEILDNMLAKKKNLRLLDKAFEAALRRNPRMFIKRIIIPLLQRDERLLNGDVRESDGVVLWSNQPDRNTDKGENHDA